MLEFSKTDNGNFLVTEKILGWHDTKIMTVEYTIDLKQKRVNKDPWQDTIEADRSWFEKYYREKFCNLPCVLCGGGKNTHALSCSFWTQP